MNDDGRKGKKGSNNMGFTYQNPFFDFYWHSPTGYNKYYTSVDQFTS